MPRPRFALPVVLAVAVWTAACTDAPVLAPGHADRVTPNLDVVTTYISPDSLEGEFIVTPTGGALTLGDLTVYFPPSSICDPNTTSYGSTEWDKPCTPATQNLKFKVMLRKRKDGKNWSDFVPNVRFVPTADSTRYVRIFMRSESARGTTDPSKYTIFYTTHVGGTLVDESVNDPTQRTSVDPTTGIASRRIKHFSGYVVQE